MTANYCETCNIVLATGSQHRSDGECIEALKQSLEAQKKLSEGIAFTVSARLLDIIGGLCAEPDVGIPYEVMMPGDRIPRRLVAYEVSGLFRAIKKKFEALGDWSPLAEAREELVKEQALNIRFQKVLERCLEHYGPGMPAPLFDDATDLVAPR